MKRLTVLTAAGTIIGIAALLVAQAPTPSADPATLQKQLADMERFLHDWPSLARYHNDDLTLAQSATREDRAVFIGDSIVERWRGRAGSFLREEPYIDRGIGGQTAPQMLVRFRPDVISLNPKVVVIMGGTNDLAHKTGPESLQDIEGYLASMAELAAANRIKVVLGSLLPVCGNYVASHPPDQILEINRWLKTYCARNHFVYLDYHSSMQDENGLLKRDLTEDCIHPNEAGFALMTPLAIHAIADASR